MIDRKEIEDIVNELAQEIQESYVTGLPVDIRGIELSDKLINVVEDAAAREDE